MKIKFDNPIKLNVFALVNSNTASAAELIAAALQDKGVKIIGERTCGKGVSQLPIPVYGGGYLNISAYEYFRKDGKPINQIGVKPDIVLDKNPYPLLEEIIAKEVSS